MGSDLTQIFDRLRERFAAQEARCIVLHDEPARFFLGTHEVRAKDGYRTWFGGVEIKKNYVSAHVMPVYVHPDMLDCSDPELRRRMQGKSCFNFKAVDERLFDELGRLIDAGANRFAQDGKL